ncbi:MAG: site-specific integrase [Candidatus Nealsonbacteria bacterium]|nr:site-specific integrase [Candidatus Nealsonbacteria bacterium]
MDEPIAYAILAAADEKNREGSEVALRADLVADLREWLEHKLKRMQEEARQRDEPIPARLPADTSVFRIPRNLVKVLNGDLKMAGIPKRDDRGRTVDVHALRHSFGTHLSKGGVAPRTAQAAMRHSTLDLTMNVYTDPRLLDVHGALDVLPGLPLNGDDPTAETATGTDGGSEKAFRKFAPGFAPTSDESCHSCPFLTTDPDERVAR